MGWLTRGLLLVVTLSLLLVPTVQLMSVVSPSVAHHLTSKTPGKASIGSRIPAVVASLPGIWNESTVRGVMTPERHSIRLGFSAAPFVPPRA